VRRLLALAQAALRRRLLGISADEIRYTFEDVRSEIRAARAELKAEIAELRRDVARLEHGGVDGDDDEDDKPVAEA
jgi:hypothetical protein